jgi:hypothetical protein
MAADIKGGWKNFRRKDGTIEKRFIPLGTRKPAHCKSCLYFRKGGGGYCTLNPNIFTHAEAEACEYYLNRTWGRENEMR